MGRRKKVADRWIENKLDELAVKEGCWYDKAAGDFACEFFPDCLRHSKGRWADEPFELLPWERKIVSKMFGWKREDGTRRIREASIWLPKKNGKSTLCSGLVLLTLVADGERSAEVYSCASSLKHGKIIYQEAEKMMKSSPFLSEQLQCVPSTSRIVFPATGSYYEVLSSNSATAEGWNIHACFFDELHRQKNPDLFNALRYGGAARDQPLFVTISTAGVYEPDSIAWRQWCYAKDVRDGVVEDTSFLPAIYAAEQDDDWTKEETWKKANPSLGLTLKLEDFRREFEKAQATPSDQNTFKRYRLNMWSQALASWIPDDKWMTCKGSIELTAEELKTIEWFGGLDMASTEDVTALTLVGEHNGQLIVLPFFWVCEAQADQRQTRDKVSYVTWIKQKHIQVAGDKSIEYATIRRDINELGGKYKIKRLAVDRWNASQLVQELDGDGFDLCYFGQGYQSMTAPIKELERLVYDGKLSHGGNPVLRWMMGNVMIRRDDADNVKISKSKSKEKVDGVVSTAMSVALWMASKVEKPSVYRDRGIMVV